MQTIFNVVVDHCPDVYEIDDAIPKIEMKLRIFKNPRIWTSMQFSEAF